ncbi:MupA/Atu3671 family FMN-dependent luciferase-like monooxygenase [Streptomyces sp. NPDC058745]|uniref:MupA/Atu3671 family FMN-dependent luciferase-like monooxygenase n=1 Tax=Streptomyces sp. NPDC058745 TaxID=3346621 RepID=UPI00367FC0B2
MPRNVNDRLAGLSPEQRAALIQELRAHRERRADSDRIPVADRTEPLPLSYVQQSLWFLDQWSDGSAFYNTPLALRMRGPLDVPLLRAALTTVTARHDTLRTRYTSTPDGPRQIVDPARGDTALRVLDLSGLPRDEREERTRAIAAEEARRRIDLSTGPMLRATLARQAEDDHVLVLAMHHIATDGWSTTRMVQELTECYLAGRSGRAPVLPELPIQYGDFAVWQRERLAGPDGGRSLAYWRDRLDGLSALQFPGDRPRPADPRWTGDTVAEHLPPELHRDLNRLAESERTRLLPVAVAGLTALMSRYTGQDDIVLGSVFSGRTRTEFEPLIGYFANTVVLRTSTAGDPTFRELLARTNDTVFGAHKHQDLPFDQLVGELRPDRDQSRNPLFQHAIYQLGTPVETVRMGDIEMTGLPLHMGTTKFDWTIGLSERSAGGVDLMAEYATELFDADRISRLLGHYRRVLESAVAHPDARLGELALLTPEERERTVVRWNDTRTPVENAGGVPAAFAAQVARTPDATAVVHRGDSLDYAALDRRANRIAHRLRGLGVGRGSLVGVCLGRSLDMPAGLLGVLKAGAAFVPLDPDYPAARLAHVLGDAAPAAVLVDTYSTERLSAAAEAADGPARPVLVDLSADSLGDVPDTAPDTVVEPHDLAYVTYTSGSTGRPKGVMVEHAQLVNLFQGLDERLGEHSPGTWLAISSISFDMSEVEMFWTLTRGFKVVVASGRPHELLRSAPSVPRRRTRPMEFGLFYFASDSGDGADGGAAGAPGDAPAGAPDRYRLLIEGAKFADRNGFSAVWTPERHFHEFGGLYPAPSVTAAALAMVTERVSIRSGSVVLPLHHPVRVAEEWSVVDNLSGGRVGMAFASGWLHDDFVFAPENYDDRKQVMIDGIATVRSLWRGESATLKAGNGKDVEVRIRPRPIQPELPVWLSSGGTPATFKAAAEQGANILTHLLGQDLDQLAESIRLYHDTWREKFGTDGGKVTLMLHAFLDEDRERALELVREPFIGYLRTSLDLVRVLGQRMGVDIDPRNIGEDDLDALLNHSFDRYVHTSGLFGTPEDCLELVDRLSEIGVDEVACLVDFGIDADHVLDGLVSLDRLRRLVEAGTEEETTSDGGATADDAPAEATLAELVGRHGVTHLQCTPSLAQLMLDDPTGDARRALGALDVLLVGGEAVPTALALRLREATGAAFHNMYGPTETTVWSTGGPIDGRDTEAPTVPVGTPLANTSVYVLDAHRAPLPVGVPGELYIGGDGVSRGYLHQPGLTRERFLPDPFSPHEGARMYRTGDHAKWLPDGRLEFLGRGDDQVKVRGFRVELGEVETVLRDHPAVGSCVVAARGPAGAQYLAAYLVAAPDHRAPDAEELRAHLRGRLPEFMIPARYVRLDELPLNANGKVDRLRLPDPAAGDAAQAAEAPVTPLQKELAEVWKQALEIESVGIRDNFFELGGHSITVIRAVDFAGKRGIRITARQLFQHQTIAELAESAGEGNAVAATGATVTPIRSGGTRPPLFCLHSSTGTSASYYPLAAHLGEDRPVYGVDAAPIVPGAAEESLDDLAERYCASIRKIQPEGPYHLLGWSLGGGIAWAVASRLQADGDTVGLLTLLDTQPPAELAEALGHAESAGAFADSFALSMGRPPLAIDLAALRPLDTEAQFGAVLDRMTEAGLVRDGERTEILARARMFTAMTRAASVWKATPYRGPVELLVADQPGDVDWFAQGWARHSDGPVRTRLVPGDHFSVMRSGSAPALAEVIGELLEGSRVG